MIAEVRTAKPSSTGVVSPSLLFGLRAGCDAASRLIDETVLEASRSVQSWATRGAASAEAKAAG